LLGRTELQSFLCHQELDGVTTHRAGEAVEDALPEVDGGGGTSVVVERAPDLLVPALVGSVVDAVPLEDALDGDRHRYHGQFL
jgi:hypothetical protein